jgi:hypothetical protein
MIIGLYLCNSIALMMEAVRTSETSVNIYLTKRQYIPEDSKLCIRRRENLKSDTFLDCFLFVRKVSAHPCLNISSAL